MPATMDPEPVVDKGTGSVAPPTGPITYEATEDGSTGAVAPPESPVVTEVDPYEGEPLGNVEPPGPTTHYQWPAEGPKTKAIQSAENKSVSSSRSTRKRR